MPKIITFNLTKNETGVLCTTDTIDLKEAFGILDEKIRPFFEGHLINMWTISKHFFSVRNRRKISLDTNFSRYEDYTSARREVECTQWEYLILLNTFFKDFNDDRRRYPLAFADLQTTSRRYYNNGLELLTMFRVDGGEMRASRRFSENQSLSRDVAVKFYTFLFSK